MVWGVASAVCVRITLNSRFATAAAATIHKITTLISARLFLPLLPFTRGSSGSIAIAGNCVDSGEESARVQDHSWQLKPSRVVNNFAKLTGTLILGVPRIFRSRYFDLTPGTPDFLVVLKFRRT